MSYQSVVARVVAAAESVGRDPASVTLVAVSKTMTVQDILAVYEVGHRDFGENRAQEVADKAPHLPDDIRWHFVGHLQSNKARLVRDTTHLLHSLDRPSLANSWLKGHGKPPPALLQINVDDEPQKSGVAPSDVSRVLEQMTALGVDVIGLMAIPKVPANPEDNREAFRSLRLMKEEHLSQYPRLTELSMGMTDDFEVAITEGASFIRVGRAIFGERKSTGD